MSTATGTTAKVFDDIAERQKKEICKYGVSVPNNPLKLRQWVKRAYDQGLDQVIYLQRIMEQFDWGVPMAGDPPVDQPTVRSIVEASQVVEASAGTSPSSDAVEIQSLKAQLAQWHILLTQERAKVAANDGPWKQAVIEACTQNHMGWKEGDPVWSLNSLLEFEIALAMDPLVSEKAAKLRDAHLEKLRETEITLAQTRSTVEALRKNLDNAIARAAAWKTNATNFAESLRGGWNNLPASMREHADLHAKDGLTATAIKVG